MFRVKDVAFSIESSLKYYILGGISTLGLLLGSFIVYSLFGTTDLVILEYLLLEDCSSISVNLSILLISLTFIFKLGLAPLHIWSVDVAKSSRVYLLLFIFTVPKIPLFVIFNKLEGLGQLQFVFVIALLSVFFGNFGSLLQYDLKRLVAFGSVSTTGFVILG
jgi:NADH-quinone oxidoreductase subunit N